MTNNLPDGITEEMAKQYGGISHICYMALECNFVGDSNICRLLDGAKHPDCPAGIDTIKRLDEKIKNDPEMQRLIAKHRKLVAECSGTKEEK